MYVKIVDACFQATLGRAPAPVTHVEVLPRVSLAFPVCVVTVGMHKLEQGSVAMGMVWKIEPHRGLFVKLPFGNSGLTSLMDLSDKYSDNPLEAYKEGQVIR